MSKNWRPRDWKANPCDGCARRVIDEYGTFCDLTCGQETCYMNYEVGADAILDAIWELAKESPTGTFTFDSKTGNIYSNEEVKDEN